MQVVLGGGGRQGKYKMWAHNIDCVRGVLVYQARTLSHQKSERV